MGGPFSLRLDIERKRAEWATRSGDIVSAFGGGEPCFVVWIVEKFGWIEV